MDERRAAGKGSRDVSKGLAEQGGLPGFAYGFQGAPECEGGSS